MVCVCVCVCRDAEMRVVDDEVVVAMDRRNLLNNRGGGGGLSVALDDANPIMIPNSRRVCGVYRYRRPRWVGHDGHDDFGW